MNLLKGSFKVTFGVFIFAFAVTFGSFFLYTLIRPFNLTSPRVLGQGGKFSGCTAIQAGSLLTSEGEVIFPGFDKWGYNYEAGLFNGGYCDAYRDASWCQPYKEVNLIMKWNDAWLSNKDCDGDGVLDRYFGYGNYQGSGAWLTNHMWGSYIGDDDKEHNWTNFVKIVAVPSDASLESGIWYDTNGEVIGAMIWGQFAVIESIYNDPYSGYHGVEFLSPTGPGFGKFSP